jgi:outer membrane protein assembly factor BamB
VYDNYILTHDLAGNIYCFDLETGKELGSMKYSGAIYSVPVIYKTRLFFIVNDLEESFSTAYYYDLKDGKILSQTKLQGGFSNQLLVNGNAIYAVSDNGAVCKINFAGYNEWIYETKTKVLSTPAMTAEKIIFATINGEIIVFDVVHKKITLEKKLGDGIFSGVVISDSTAYTCDDKGVVYCFNINDGTVNWKADTGSKVMSMPVYDANNLYVSNMAGVISCFNRLSGELKWKTNIGGAPIATPLLFNNYIIQPNLNSHLFLINTSDGSVQKKIKFAGRMKLSPVMFNNLLILGFDKGNIEAFEITEVK